MVYVSAFDLSTDKVIPLKQNILDFKGYYNVGLP